MDPVLLGDVSVAAGIAFYQLLLSRIMGEDQHTAFIFSGRNTHSPRFCAIPQAAGPVRIPSFRPSLFPAFGGLPARVS